jgi:predicted MFS family arabinose efflux permease
MAYSYREVLKQPRALRLFAAASLGRLSFAMGPLALVLFMQAARGSFAVAGAASAATALASGLFAPVRGRLVDRHGQSRTLPALALLYAAAFGGVVLVARGGAVTAVIAVLLSGLAGAVAPPLPASMRVLWGTLVGAGPRLQTALALDSVVEDVVYTMGPLLAGGLSAAFSPAVALGVVAVLAVAGSVAFVSSPVSRTWSAPAAEVRGGVGWAGAMGERGIRTLVLSLAGFGAAIGIIDITLVAAAREAGSAPLGGVLLALLSAGSVAGGLWYGSRAWRLDAGQRFVRILALLALVAAFLPLARSLVLLGIVVVAAGLLLSPLESSAYVLASQLAPAGTVTEAASWVTTANNVTAAAGIALAGVLVGGPGVIWALVAAWASVVLALLVALLGRDSLRAVPAATSRERSQRL